MSSQLTASAVRAPTRQGRGGKIPLARYVRYYWARSLRRADIPRSTRQLASPRCCSLRPATDQVGRLRIHLDLGQRSNLQLDFDYSENAELRTLHLYKLMRRSA